MKVLFSNRRQILGFVPALIVLVWATAAQAVPARPRAATVSQPDGSHVTVFARGDEHSHWYQDGAGYLVTRSKSTRFWVYALQSDGKIQPTELVVGRDAPQGIPKVDSAARPVTASAKRARALSASMRQGAQAFGASGTMRNLVLLVNFTDKTITKTRQQFDDLCNLSGYSTDGARGSIRDYYLEVSYGALTMDSVVVEAVTLDHDYAYYGQNDTWEDDLLPASMVRDALVKVEERGFDFRSVDGNGDGYVDAVTVIHAGVGEEIGTDPDTIWSHKSELGNPLTFDGVIIQTYCTVPADRDSSGGITRIGVICHELGHVLGLPDLYDRDYSSQGAGCYCLMASGSWNGGDGQQPAHLSAWCKIALNWVVPSVISQVGMYTVGQAETYATAFKIQGAFSANEYFLMENRQGQGFDQSLPGLQRGVLIWHVDDAQADNDDETHFKVGLVEAGPSGQPVQHLLDPNSACGGDEDYFRQGNVTAFSSKTDPAAVSYYDEIPLGFGIRKVSATGQTMTFEVYVVDPLSIYGYIRSSDGTGIDGVLVTEDADGGWDMTDTDGFYRLPVRLGWSGTVSLSKLGYVFEPASRTYQNVRQDIGDQHYIATPGEVSGITGTLSVRTVSADGQDLSGGIYVDNTLMGTGSWSGEIPVGSHLVTYGVLDGYTRPDGQLVEVLLNDTTEVTGTYTAGTTTPSAFTVTTSVDPNGYLSPGTSVRVSAQSSGGSAPYTYVWNTGVHWPSLQVAPTVTTTYTVNVTDSTGATATGTATVQIVVGVTASANPQVVAEGETSTVTATAQNGQAPYTYSWNTGETTAAITVSPTGPTDYTVTVTDATGTQATATVRVSTPVVQGAVTSLPCLFPAAIVGLAILALGWMLVAASPRTRP